MDLNFSWYLLKWSEFSSWASSSAFFKLYFTFYRNKWVEWRTTKINTLSTQYKKKLMVALVSLKLKYANEPQQDY